MGTKMDSELQKKLTTELEKFQALQKDHQKFVKARQVLDGQLSENTLVKEELVKLDSSANVYKMIGPVFVKQDIAEAKEVVQKRIDYISGEVKRHEDMIKDLDKKQESQKEILQKLQTQFQQSQQKAAIKT
ncbi:prefoldin subunit 6-like [Ruditapes philippinarum]|uniref:prefoldin subunit 6-like n=1 Tax=Ruditapes philippinarum TaxID=129788 RepID=UPI00295A6D06|nr:prefoldin subunit 6-like [Ruditapes philippinarum]